MLRAVGSMTITRTTLHSQYHAYSAKLPTLKTDEMRRLVGHLEYSRALSLLEPLVSKATAEELTIMDQIVASRDEFTVYTNISRRIPKQAESALDERAADSASFAKRGLAWVMGLARVELGAMVAGFTGVREPFATLPPTRFELPAYAELLGDGARTHFWSLGNDSIARSYASYRDKPLAAAQREHGREEVDDTQAIAYGRRAALAREFIRASQALSRGQLTPAQATELAAWEKELDVLIETIAFKVLGLGESSYTVVGTSNQVRNIKAGERMDNCPFLRCDRTKGLVTPTPATSAPGVGAANTSPAGGPLAAKANAAKKQGN
jgi:hypothetical protein